MWVFHVIIHIVVSSLQRQWVMTSISLGVLFCCIKYSISFYFEWKGLLFVLLDIKRPLVWLHQFIFWHDTQKFSLDILRGSPQHECSGLWKCVTKEYKIAVLVAIRDAISITTNINNRYGMITTDAKSFYTNLVRKP